MTARDVLAAYVESLYNCAPNTKSPLRACQKAAHRIVQGDLDPAALEAADALIWRLEDIRTEPCSRKTSSMKFTTSSALSQTHAHAL